MKRQLHNNEDRFDVYGGWINEDGYFRTNCKCGATSSGVISIVFLSKHFPGEVPA
jgi:hypothetical protein